MGDYIYKILASIELGEKVFTDWSFIRGHCHVLDFNVKFIRLIIVCWLVMKECFQIQCNIHLHSAFRRRAIYH